MKTQKSELSKSTLLNVYNSVQVFINVEITISTSGDPTINCSTVTSATHL